MKGIEFINKSIAADKHLPIKLVERVNRFYWKQGIKQRLARLEVDAIYVKNFGTFRVSNRKLKNHIVTTIRRIRALRVTTRYRETTRLDKLNRALTALVILLQRRNTLAKLYYEQNNRVDKVTSESNGESGESSGRDIQLDPTSFGYPA